MILEQLLAQTLTKKKKTLCVAESCTGGLLCDRITNISGSSTFFKGGVVTYSNEIKSHLLKISTGLLKKHGAVSQPVAKTMAIQARKIFKTDWAVAITGIAGPTGGNKQKPVGTTFIGVAHLKKVVVKKFLFKGTRSQIKQQATTQAIKLLLFQITITDKKL